MRVAIIGAGVAGLTAAYELSKRNHQVVVFESSEQTGGLASGFRDERWEWALERFYHHWFTSDHAIINLINEIGQGEQLFFPRPITSLWHKDKAYPFDNYLRAMLFPHLSLFDKARMGPAAFYLRLTRNWQALERTTAHEWCMRWMGANGYRLLFEPLLVGKFGDYYQTVNMAWFWARIYKRSPRLGYFAGGFQAFVDALTQHVQGQGVTLRLNTPIAAIRSTSSFSPPLSLGEGPGVREPASGVGEGPGVREPAPLWVQPAGAAEAEQFDRVIVTLSPGLLMRLAPELPTDYLAGLRQLKSMGATVLILALRQQLTKGHYWINLPKGEGFPFLALVEHTNFIDPAHYGGDHLVYCGDYLKPDHEYFSLSQDELLARFLPSLSRFNPDFRPDWVRRSWLFREQYAQPVPGLNHSRNIPDLATPVPGLFWASMSQVYPWDRGTNYAVELGQEVARRATQP